MSKPLLSKSAPPQKQNTPTITYPHQPTDRQMKELISKGLPATADRDHVWLNMAGPTSKNPGKLYWTWGDDFLFFDDRKWSIEKAVKLGKITGAIKPKKETFQQEESEERVHRSNYQIPSTRKHTQEEENYPTPKQQKRKREESQEDGQSQPPMKKKKEEAEEEIGEMESQNF